MDEKELEQQPKNVSVFFQSGIVVQNEGKCKDERRCSSHHRGHSSFLR